VFTLATLTSKMSVRPIIVFTKDKSQCSTLVLRHAWLSTVYKKLSYRRETARQLPTWRGLLMPTLLLELTTTYGNGKMANSSISTTPLKFEDVPARNAFEYQQMIYIARK